MKKKKYIKRAVKILSLVLAVVLCAGILQEYLLCRGGHDRGCVRGFYLEDEDSLDVVFIGASDVYAGFSSCYAYEKFGFTSYPIASAANIAPNFKAQLKEAIRQQHPKLIVIEVNGMLYGEDADYEKEERIRKYVDNMPFNSNKVELIESYDFENPWEYYLPIIKYHTIWKDFPQGLSWDLSIIQARMRGYSYLKGATTNAQIYKTKKKIYNDTLKKDEIREDLNENAEKILRDLLEYCRSENIDNVVFARFPHVVIEHSLPTFHRSNRAGDIIAEYGYDYINCDKNFEDTGIDVTTDFYNWEHLNIYGQLKFTEYFGRILQEKYGISESELSDSQKQQWDTCAKYYDAFCKYTFSLLDKKQSKKGKDPKKGGMPVGESYSNLKRIEKFL